MADADTRSSGAVPSAVAVLVGTNLEMAPFGARKTPDDERVGRSVGREEKDLTCISYVA